MIIRNYCRAALAGRHYRAPGNLLWRDDTPGRCRQPTNEVRLGGPVRDAVSPQHVMKLWRLFGELHIGADAEGVNGGGTLAFVFPLQMLKKA